MTQYLLQIALAGIAQGSLFALTALGLVMIYNASSVVNFAHGAMGMAATYVAYLLITKWQAPFALAFAGALVAAFVLGVVVQTLFLARLRHAPLMSQVVVTLGLFMLLEGLLGLAFGYNPRPMSESIAIKPVILGNLVLRPQDVLELALLLVLGLALAALFAATKVGLGMRAITENPYAAQLMGIPVGRVLAIAWGVGVMLSAVVAILAAPMTSVTPNMMDTIVVYGFVAAIVGGFGSMAGALAGGLILGVVVNMIDAFVAPELAMSIVFGLLLVVLYVKPDGLFGRVQVQKV
ncbi:MAG TPA: branched-chain amino acid ABC transporter permease [Casimicrobiaceae bacterium]|jgi:branched-chain amino acid transport system permease protein|nr:branched-chain amino acid ABC transporter permease [Casimicrobiaceae bacterium]